MTRSSRTVAAGMVFAVAALAGCGTDRDMQRSGMSQSSPLSGPGVPASTPSRDASVQPSQSATDQDRLDEQLREAAWNNDIANASRLIRLGADVNAKDETVQSAYLIATSEGYLDLLRLALRNGAKIDDKDSWNGTGLIRAAERGHYLVVGQLLQAGIDRDHVNRIGYQAIHEAVWLGEDTHDYAATLRVLAAGSVQLDQPSRDEQLTPLQMARHRGHEGLRESADPDNHEQAIGHRRRGTAARRR